MNKKLNFINWKVLFSAFFIVFLVFSPSNVQAGFIKEKDFDYFQNGSTPQGSVVDLNGILYGLTSEGGANTSGTIFSFDPVNDTLTDLYDFDVFPDGGSPRGSLYVYNGLLYGFTSTGGGKDYGTIFSFDPANNTFTNLHDFDTTPDGGSPRGSFISYNGILYGLTSYGGANGAGTIFSFDPANNTFTNLHDFGTLEGILPFGSLIDLNGILYGLTNIGGDNNLGTIFSFDPANNTFTNLHDFDTTPDGGSPRGSFISYNGILYGLTSDGGANGAGTIFSFDPANNTFTNLHDFGTAPDGSYPADSLLNLNGVFYGLTQGGGANTGGTIFSFDPANNTFTNLHDFSTLEGILPFGSLIDLNGILYGLTSAGGANGLGTIFSYDPVNYIPVATNVAIGGHAYVGQVLTGTYTYFDNDDIEGISTFKWYRNDVAITGAVDSTYTLTLEDIGKTIKFEVTPIASTGPVLGDSVLSSGVLITLNPRINLYDFNSVPDGDTPQGSFISYNGILYGLTSAGGANGAGTIFSFDPANNTFTNLHDFSTLEGILPFGSLIDLNGILYGLTSGGGANGAGTIFSFDPANNTFTNLHDFDTTPDGGSPQGSLISYNGILYGLTNIGGDNNLGTIFSFDPANNTFTNLHDFGILEGSFPFGSLVDLNGTLYGLTTDGGTNTSGTIFSFDPANNTFTNLHDFDFTPDGGSPQGSLISYNGILYGLTNVGGLNSYGTIFSFNPGNNTLTNLHDFDTTPDGSYPYDSLFSVNDVLYGLTSSGGLNGYGTIFSYNTTSDVFVNLQSFEGASFGAIPVGSLSNLNGTLYGLTSSGGSNGYGTIFSYQYDVNLLNSDMITLFPYESDDIEVSPSSPGVLVDFPSYSNILEADSNYLATADSSLDGGYDSQVYKVQIDQTGIVNPKFTVNWVGHGDTPVDKLVYIKIWNFDTDTWENVFSNHCATDCTINTAISGLKYSSDNYVWVWVKADNGSAQHSLTTDYFNLTVVETPVVVTPSSVSGGVVLIPSVPQTTKPVEINNDSSANLGCSPVQLENSLINSNCNNINGGYVFSFVKNLRLGSFDNETKKLQSFLNQRGFTVSKIGLGSSGREIKRFGLRTKKALVLFQKRYGLVPDGIFGPKTRAVTNNLLK